MEKFNMFERVKLHRINDHIWLMNDADEATGYIVAGKERALVIDSMNGFEDVKAIARTVTDLPLLVLNTHGHPDHIFGDVYFDQVYIHPADMELAGKYMQMPEFQKAVAERGVKIPDFLLVENGDVFELGGLELEVFHVPGHTPGGICLLDRKDRILFSGDSIIEQTWMQMEESLPMEVFRAALETLQPVRGEFDWILTGHTRKEPEDASLYEAHKQAVQEILDGNSESDTVYEWFGGTAMAHPYGKEPRRIVYKIK